jgi:hypothetical protein
MSIDPKKAVADINAVMAHKPAFSGSSAMNELGALMVACIKRWAPPGSSYQDLIAKVDLLSLRSQQVNESLRGVLVALRRDYDQGQVATFEELVHAAVFDDLLAQAEYYLDEGHLLPSTVVSGAALEEHLRQLARKHGLPTATTNPKGKTTHRKASELNDDLHKAKAYSQPEWRQTQVWLDLRNEAAHGKPEFQQRTDADIRPMVTGIGALIVKYPA